MYKNTLLKQDGTTQDLGTTEKELSLEQLYKILNCSIIEAIPEFYYKTEAYICWGDEEGRFKDSNIRNPHMKAVTDVNGMVWDCVGDIVMVQKVKKAEV